MNEEDRVVKRASLLLRLIGIARAEVLELNKYTADSMNAPSAFNDLIYNLSAIADLLKPDEYDMAASAFESFSAEVLLVERAWRQMLPFDNPSAWQNSAQVIESMQQQDPDILQILSAIESRIAELKLEIVPITEEEWRVYQNPEQPRLDWEAHSPRNLSEIYESNEGFLADTVTIPSDDSSTDEEEEQPEEEDIFSSGPRENSDETRGLCAVCSRYDWEFLLRYDERLHECGVVYERRILLTGEEILPTDVRGKEGQSLTKPPFTGRYELRDSFDTLYTYVLLSPLSTMYETRSHCSLCDLFVRMYVATPHHRDKPVGNISCRIEMEPNRVCLRVYTRTVDDDFWSDEGYDLGSKYASGPYMWFNVPNSIPNDDIPELKQFPLAKKADIDILKTLWNSCHQIHSETCYTKFQQEMLSALHEDSILRFRVIDVKTCRVVKPLMPFRYVALSYVWGRIPSVQLRRADVLNNNLGEERIYVQLERSSLLPTIADAIAFTELMGERYIWIDQLCIAQDDDAEVSYATSAMDKIYGASTFTIIADGQDARSGLVGLKENSRSLPIVTAIIDGTTIHGDPQISSTSLSLNLERSKWNTRGWTYQELRLSSRHFIFVGDRVYYHCSEGSEVDTTPGRALRRLEAKYDDGGPFWEYAGHVVSYSPRQLTDQSDILKAFGGIMSDFARRYRFYNLHFFFGIPLNDRSAHALLWRYSGSEGDHIQRRPGFPSWSWASYVSSAEYKVTDFDKLELRARPKDESWGLAADGILEFEALCITIDVQDIMPSGYRLDDGSMWTTGCRPCLLIATTSGDLVDGYFMIVRKGDDGVFYREGLFIWRSMSGRAERDRRSLDIRLG